ncbi:MAG: zinc ribbon domain-containing protein [Candidatus Heimdallarchaeota archaeon]
MSYMKKSFGRGNLWTLGMGIGFILWGILYYTVASVHTGGWWCFIPGGILFFSGVSNIVAYRYNRERILGALKSYKTVSLEQLANELKMTQKTVKEIIVDLRTEGKLKASFDPESGDVMILEVKGQPPITGAPVATSKETAKIAPALTHKEIKAQGYCPYCGSIISSSDRFCNNCGSAIE